MKFFNKEISKPKPVFVPIARGDELYVFKCEAVLDYSEFERLCPRPAPFKKILAGGKIVEDSSSPEFLQTVRDWSAKRTAWMFIQSLKNSEGLTWDRVDYDNPDTWTAYEDELHDASFSQVEINEILNGCLDANCLNDDKIKEARDRFFRGQQGTE